MIYGHDFTSRLYFYHFLITHSNLGLSLVTIEKKHLTFILQIYSLGGSIVGSLLIIDDELDILAFLAWHCTYPGRFEGNLFDP